MHEHRPIPTYTRETVYTGALGENPMATGGITLHEECRCGATRTTNVNGRHEETSGWIEQEA